MAASDTRSCTMVAEAAAEIVSQKLDILLSHPVCVECSSMQARAKDAKAKLAPIQEFMSTQYRPSKTTEWSGRLLQAMCYADEFIDKFHLRETRKRHEALHMAAWPLAAVISKCKLWRDLSKLVNKMEKLCDEKFLKEEAEGKGKKDPASSSSHARVPWQGTKLARLTSFWDRYEPILFSYLKTRMKEIMDRIRMTSEDIQVTPILGKPGTGKTILARKVYNQAKYMGYEGRAWVHVSASMDKREFLFEILKQIEKLAREMKDMDIEEIRKMLRQKLTEMNPFLIVLDDVPSLDDPLFLELAMVIPLFLPGHIIFTTQDIDVVEDVDELEKGPIRLEYLYDKESQEMLARKLHGGRDAQSLTDEERDILNRCDGSPLSISLLGGLLSNAGEHERAALVNGNSKMELSDLVQLSYHRLPVHLKPCLIFMVLFPRASPIPTRRLVRLWLAEGLLDSHCCDREMKRTPEDVGETFILELADRNMIDVVSWRADGSPKACEMLTSLYEMIYQTAMSTGFLYVHTTSKSKDGNDRDPTGQQQEPLVQSRERAKVRWLAEHTNIVTDGSGGSFLNSNLRHIRSFLSFYLRRGVLTKEISTFLRKMTSETDYSLLRVLDLEGVYKPSLQDVLHKLVLLRYLGLRSTVLDSLPSAVAGLQHLETFDIKHTNVTSLPSSLWKARNLRHLHLNWFYIDLKMILKACGDDVMALAKLQTLSGLVIGEAKEISMTGHINILTTLTKLKLFLQHSENDTSGAAGQRVADWISFKLTNLQSLTFGVIQEAQPVEKATEVAKPGKEAQPAKDATKKAEGVEVAEAEKSQIGLLPKLSLAGTHNELLELYLMGRLNKPSWTELFPVSLRVLTLSGSRVEARDMIPQLGGLLRHLRTLRLLAYSFLGTSLTFVEDGFPSLKFLKIWKLPQLKEVIIQPGAMPHLQELEFRHLDAKTNVEGINKCEKLENIPVLLKKDAHVLVDRLNGVKGAWTNVYEIKETEMLGTMDDDDREPDDGEDASP